MASALERFSAAKVPRGRVASTFDSAYRVVVEAEYVEWPIWQHQWPAKTMALIIANDFH